MLSAIFTNSRSTSTLSTKQTAYERRESKHIERCGRNFTSKLETETSWHTCGAIGSRSCQCIAKDGESVADDLQVPEEYKSDDEFESFVGEERPTEEEAYGGRLQRIRLAPTWHTHFEMEYVNFVIRAVN